MDANSSMLLDVSSGNDSDVTIMDLPTVIMVEIVSRLPIKDIFRSKCVCKSWYNLSSDPLFAKMYHSRSHPFPCLLLCPFSNSNASYCVSSLIELKADYDYYSFPENKPINLSPNFHLPPLKPGTKFELSGSCNGFIGLFKHDDDHAVYICNPLLGEYFKLKLPKKERSESFVKYVLCFSEVSRQYKVLRSDSRSIRYCPGVSNLKVYTIGVDADWRNVGKAPHNFGIWSFYVNVNGALHWINSENSKHYARVYSFDIETEKVQNIPMPPAKSRCFKLGALNNCLCLVDNVYKQHIDIWTMKEYGITDSWTKDRILWNSIPLGIRCDNFLPLVVWKDGEILMQSQHTSKLLSYNPKEKELREVNINGSKIESLMVDEYIPSFHSLKTILGGSNDIKSNRPKQRAS